MTHDKKIRLMIRAAQMYYYDDLSYAQIAQKLEVSRWTVSRMIQRVRDQGIVRITIEHPLARYREAEEKLIQQYHLEDVIVVPSWGNDKQTFSEVCRSAAEYLCEQMPAPKKIAVSWGRTMAKVGYYLPDKWTSGITVFQTNGGPSYTEAPIVEASLQMIASKGQGTGRILPVPAIMKDPKVAEGIMRDPVIGKTLQEAAQVDMICFSPGSISESSVLRRSGYVAASDIEKLLAMGAKGDILCRFVDEDGEPVSQELNRCTIGLSLTALRQAKKRLVVVSGSEKLDSLRAVLRGGYATNMIIDSKLADALLDKISAEAN